MRTGLKKSFLWIAVAVIAILLTIQYIFSYQNSKIIDENIKIRRQAESVKVNTLDIIRTLHQLDIGLRGFALTSDSQLAAPFKMAPERMKIVLTQLERSLDEQHFSMSEFYQMQDSVKSYFKIADTMFAYIERGKRDEFTTMIKADYGYSTWQQYLRFSAIVNAFENVIIQKANRNYQLALQRNYRALLILILLVVPTLLYTVYSTVKAFGVSEQLRESEEDKNRILLTQNDTLERMVKERTEEITSQSEQIQTNLDFISKRNEELEIARKVIEQKNQIIESRNKNLGMEVEKQTEHLKESNRELIKNINQLEQFTYTVSHNLRAPVARLIGLTNILKHATEKVETELFLSKISESSLELDQVFKDLIQTIEIKKEVNNSMSNISVEALLNKIFVFFHDEITALRITTTVNTSAKTIISISAYVESILFNLVSNAIKYRDPLRLLAIEIETSYEGTFFILKVRDNGLGLDVARNKRDLFNFYKRFHFHVEGRGLGLYLVKSQVDLLGGSIDVESALGEGTTFIVKLKHNLVPVPA